MNHQAFAISQCSAAVVTHTDAGPSITLLWHGSQVIVSGTEQIAALREAVECALASVSKPEVCGNCDTELPGGCGGIFKNDGAACKFDAARLAEKGKV